MKNRLFIPLCIVILTVLASACNKNPKVVSENGDENSTGIFSEEHEGHNHPHDHDAHQQESNNDLHKVQVKEVLYTIKYVYLFVTENDEDFWIATQKIEAKIGEIYYYRGGLLKTNFESKEHNRFFDRIFLVSSLVREDHGNQGGSELAEILSDKSKASTSMKTTTDGSISIADLVSNYKKYIGKTVQVSGKCIKLNANIMGKNWVHLQDGTMDEYDLVITTDAIVHEGESATFKALVSADQNFGAGYQYELILEKGELVQ
jgi:hypothetical protein